MEGRGLQRGGPGLGPAPLSHALLHTCFLPFSCIWNGAAAASRRLPSSCLPFTARPPLPLPLPTHRRPDHPDRRRAPGLRGGQGRRADARQNAHRGWQRKRQRRRRGQAARQARGGRLRQASGGGHGAALPDQQGGLHAGHVSLGSELQLELASSAAAAARAAERWQGGRGPGPLRHPCSHTPCGPPAPSAAGCFAFDARSSSHASTHTHPCLPPPTHTQTTSCRRPWWSR